MKFVDEVEIRVEAGDGGNGCVSFRREKFVPKGGPDGGDGGGGGSVILRTCAGEQSMVALAYKRHHTGQRGPHGKGKTRHGRRGEHAILEQLKQSAKSHVQWWQNFYKECEISFIPIPLKNDINDEKNSINLFSRAVCNLRLRRFCAS